MAFLGVGKKKEQKKEDDVLSTLQQPLPLEQINSMRQQGYTNEQIIQALQQQGYAAAQISDAMNQAYGYGQYPQPQQDYGYQYSQQQYQQPQQQPQVDQEKIEQVVEAITEEKWNGLSKDIRSIIEWKDKSETRIVQLQQQMADLKEDMESLKRNVLGKVTEYDKNITNVGTEIKAMEKVFQKVLPSLTDSVNKLERMSRGVKEQEQKK